MTVSCFPRTEAQLRRIVTSLKEAGLFNQYEEQAHGEHVLICVQIYSAAQKELVKELFREAGIFELIYTEESAA